MLYHVWFQLHMIGGIFAFRILKALIYSEVPLTSELYALGLYNFITDLRGACEMGVLKPDAFFVYG